MGNGSLNSPPPHLSKVAVKRGEGGMASHVLVIPKLGRWRKEAPESH